MDREVPQLCAVDFTLQVDCEVSQLCFVDFYLWNHHW